MRRVFFGLSGLLVAACPERIPDMNSITDRLRSAMKRNGHNRDIGGEVARNRLYRTQYGARPSVVRPAPAWPSVAGETK